MIELKRMGKVKNIFIIPSLVMDDPDCHVLIKVVEDLREIIDEINQYFREII